MDKLEKAKEICKKEKEEIEIEALKKEWFTLVEKLEAQNKGIEKTKKTMEKLENEDYCFSETCIAGSGKYFVHVQYEE